MIKTANWHLIDEGVGKERKASCKPTWECYRGANPKAFLSTKRLSPVLPSNPLRAGHRWTQMHTATFTWRRRF